MKTSSTTFGVALIFALLQSSAVASKKTDARTQTGPFVSLSTGASAIAFSNIKSNEIGETSHDDAVGKVEAGYWLSNHWGVSANYVYLGKFKQTYSEGIFRGKAESFGISLLGRLPFGEKWSLVGKANLLRTKMDDDGSTVGAALRNKLTGKENSLVLPGLEINYHINDQAAVFLELDTRGSVSDNVDLGYAGIGLRWAF